jgi:hypothetical protein
MLLPTPLSLLFSALLLSTATTAAPTRTNCRCIVVAETPSAAHWTPLDPTPSASPSASLDKCAALGPELQLLQHADPAQYAAYLFPGSKSIVQKPLSTTALLHAAAANGAQPNSVPTPTASSQSSEKIVCFSEPSAPVAYSDNCTLWILQIIVACTIIACIAEAFHLAMRWFMSSRSSPAEPVCEKPKRPLRLSGSERLLCAFPAAGSDLECVSPGADKKTRAYESTKYFVVKAPCGRREFIAYDSEDDDESNRPVM